MSDQPFTNRRFGAGSPGGCGEAAAAPGLERRAPRPATLPEPTAEALELGARAGTSCIGDPDEVQRAVQSYVDIGADQLVFGMLSTTMPIEVAVEAVDTFGRHVLPKFDTDSVHSTTRRARPSSARTAEPLSG